MEGWSVSAETASAEATRRLASSLAELSRPGDLILLVGELGAGKTVFAQGFASGLGFEGKVTSPTFALLKEYPFAPRANGLLRMLHADMYRLDALNEVVELGLPELLDDGSVAVVEWGDIAEPVLGGPFLRVTLVPSGLRDASGLSSDESRRDLTLSGVGPDWADRRSSVAAVVTATMGEQ